MEDTKFTIYSEEKSQDYGRFCIEPLARGYGDTLGNALRRLLLSSIKGAAVTAVKIDGVLHEFSTIKGIREDVIEILMNLKHIPIRAKTEQSEVNEEGFKIITLDSDELPKDFFTREENRGVITAKDMPWDNDFEFCGDGVLCTLEPDAHLLMEIYVEQGVGYLSAERERPSQPPLPIDAMLADAIFSPVKRVNYQIEPARVGQSIDFERLILEVWTNGAVKPEDAVKEAAELAQGYFAQIAEMILKAPQKNRPVDEPEPDKPVEGENTEEELEHLKHSIHELELSIRSENCLLRGGIQTIGDLLQKSREDLLKIRNLGRKSLREIEEKLTTFGYALMPSPPAPEEGEEYFDDPDESGTVEESPAPEPESEQKPQEEAPAPEPEAKTAKTRRTTRKSKAKAEETSEQEAAPEPEPEEKPEKPKRTRKKKTADDSPKAEAKPKTRARAKAKAEPETEPESEPEKSDE